MDIHRCRFVPYPPSTINALAFSHSHITSDEKTAPPRLAVGRANGDIEIWNPLKGSWLQETIIRGGKDRSIDGLVWTQDPNEEDASGRIIIGKSRLFSIGYTTTVTEWDLEKGQPLRETSGNHGEIWCIAAQPAVTPIAIGTNGTATSQWPGQSLVTGCTDGALVLYSTKDEDLQLQRVLARPSSKKGKAISIAFQDRNVVVAGYTDSTIRLVDIRNSVMLRSMTLGSGPKGGPKEIIVWSVKVLADGTIVSGDSTGEVKIWDGKTYTLRQRIKSHRQDILSLATSFDESAIFSGGMDRRTVVYKPVGKGKPRWAEVAHRRFHKHDVKTMASFEGNGMSVIVSGGPDASPTVVPLGQYGFENQRSLPFLSQESILRSAPKKRLMMSWWDREVHIWRLSTSPKPPISEDSEEEPPAQSRKLVAKILIKGEANITSADLSADGNVLVVSTTTDIKLFLLRPRSSSDEDDTLRISKLAVPSTFSFGARQLQFSPDGKWLCCILPNSHITLARILTSTSSPPNITIHPQLTRLTRLDRQIEKHITLGGLGNYDRTITQIAFSADSRILAVSDLAGYIDTFILSGAEDLTLPPPNMDDASPSDSDSEDEDAEEEETPKEKKLILGQHWTRNPSASSLPKLPSTPVVLSFRPAATELKALTNGTTAPATRKTPNPIPRDIPAGEDRLLTVTATSEVFEFSVLKGGLSDWSRRNPTSSFPDKFRKTLETVKGCIWDISDEKERVWLYSVNSLWMFDLSRDFPSEESEQNGNVEGGDALVSKKRKRRHGKAGAGGEIPAYKKNNMGISRTVEKIVHEEVEEVQPLFPDEVEDDGDEYETALERLQRVESTGGSGGGEEKPHHWQTFKYRPIMGIVRIGDGNGEGSVGPEVAVVERPIWEVELPPRYYGDQEWKDREVDIV